MTPGHDLPEIADPAAPGSASQAGRVAILLSTYNGARHLPEQLASLTAQIHADWILFWRDDGSTDETVAIVAAFAARHPGCCVRVAGRARLGIARSYFRLMDAALEAGCEAFAFADQDDVWLPHKLGRAMAALDGFETPALYCARQILVDARLDRIALSPRLRRPPGFAAALTQNVATGCTVVLNAQAAQTIARATPPADTWHDWWCYLVVTACGGTVLTDQTPVVLYRQHSRNAIGAPRSLVRRGSAALRRGPSQFMTVFHQHVAALEAQQHLLDADARAVLTDVRRAMASSRARRWRALRRPDLARQTWPETFIFRLWCLMG